MKVKTFFLFISMLFTCNMSCLADDGGGLPIDIIPTTNGNGPHRTPNNAKVSGVFNMITQTLFLNVSEEADVSVVTIIKDGVLIILEDVSSEVPGIIIYDLSSWENGSYQVIVNGNSGYTYTGSFCY